MPNENRSSVAGDIHQPDGSILTLADLPRPREDHWSPQRKARVVAAMKTGLLSRAQAQTRYELSHEELASWERAYAASPAPSAPNFILSPSRASEDQAHPISLSSPDRQAPMSSSHGGKDA